MPLCPWQVAVAALGALEAVPASRLQALLADGALGARILACLSSSSKQVGAWAFRWLQLALCAGMS